MVEKIVGPWVDAHALGKDMFVFSVLFRRGNLARRDDVDFIVRMLGKHHEAMSAEEKKKQEEEEEKKKASEAEEKKGKKRAASPVPSDDAPSPSRPRLASPSPSPAPVPTPVRPNPPHPPPQPSLFGAGLPGKQKNPKKDSPAAPVYGLSEIQTQQGWSIRKDWSFDQKRKEWSRQLERVVNGKLVNQVEVAEDRSMKWFNQDTRNQKWLAQGEAWKGKLHYNH